MKDNHCNTVLLFSFSAYKYGSEVVPLSEAEKSAAGGGYEGGPKSLTLLGFVEQVLNLPSSYYWIPLIHATSFPDQNITQSLGQN